MKKIGLIFFLILEAFQGSTNLFGQPNGFTTAYDNMHLQFSSAYPFGKWKAVDWNALNSKIRPKIVNAGAAILEINDQPIPATLECKKLHQYRLIGRIQDNILFFSTFCILKSAF